MSTKKQGGYGKLVIHKESKISQIMRVDEVLAAIKLVYLQPLTSNLKDDGIQGRFKSTDLEFCDEILSKVSRSFAAVIRQLPQELLVDVMVFYLVLRALDTIEDDMTAFSSTKTKITHLQNFSRTALADPEWRMMGVGEADEKRLLEEFPKCHSVFMGLGEGSRKVIVDIAERMAGGMAEFVEKDLGEGTKDIREYNRYCHFVAGLVGEGLSRLFASSSLERPSLAAELHLSDQMGLFLQKTNIIRDYLEDYVDGRAFWPKEVWEKYSLDNKGLGYFVNQADLIVQAQSRALINELVTDALELAPNCLAYLANLRCAEVFRFCAIPQVMAIATLDKVYDNLDVYTGVVKIRKGLSCQLILNTTDVNGVHKVFNKFARNVIRRVDKNDPSAKRTIKACKNILELTAKPNSQTNMIRVLNVLVPVVLG
ncbi:hypothetical protein ScalyP_jg10098, partial [Parmales sp. scaly parma]